MQATESGIGKKPRNKAKKKHGDSILPGLGRLVKSAEQIAQTAELLRAEARAAEAKRADDNARLVSLVRVGFTGKFEGTVKNHPAYTPDDLVFFRSYGFNV